MKHLSWHPYSIQFMGSVSLDRPLLPAQAAYVWRFLTTRRITWQAEKIAEIADPLREAVGLPLGAEGAYFVGLNFDELKVADWRPLVVNQNKPPQGQPLLWCFWRLEEDRSTLSYVGTKYELHYCSVWLAYLIEHFFRCWGYTVNGEMAWQGDDPADGGMIVVSENRIEQRLSQSAGEPRWVWPDQPIACAHQNALETKLVCTHLATRETEGGWGRWFTGQSRDFHLICTQCLAGVKKEGRTPPLSQICWRCYNELVAEGYVGEIAGQPEVFVRAPALSLACQKKEMALTARILDIQPVDTRRESVWIALTHEGKLIEINVTTETLTPLMALPASKLDLEQEVALRVAPGGRYIAVVNTYGQHGLVLNLEIGLATMQLERDDYCVDVCYFPVAFFQDGQRVLLVHGTDWNRLDIADPRTGEALTERSFDVKPDQKHSAHHLEYFHGRLRISPDQQWVVDDGWIWHPVGAVVVWNVQRWLHENLWESEDGPSLLSCCQRDGYWGGPLCWIDERTVAVWGYGDDADWLLPAVRFFDIVAEKELDWFAGPEGELVYDEYLFALSEQHGLTAWDVATGERVFAEPGFHPTRYHRGAKQFLQINEPDGSLYVGMLAGFKFQRDQ